MFSHQWIASGPAAGIANVSPPDVVLEVGPPPTVRYVAHGVLLAAHSGYLRSAIRLESSAERPSTVEQPPAAIYVPNVTADQFGPLLTYIYTGYLDLNPDNIFAVLLASHVLHMPRASDICRGYLARTQAADAVYLGGAAPMPLSMIGGATTRIIRPIASKAAAVSGRAFAAPPVSTVLLPSRDTPFRSWLPVDMGMGGAAVAETIGAPPNDGAVVAAKQIVRSPKPPNIATVAAALVTVPLKAVACGNSRKRPNSQQQQQNKKELLVASAGVQIGEVVDDAVRFHETADGSATTLAAVGRTNKPTTIIDIASCDGPVRFRRVLNEAYGRTTTACAVVKGPAVERSHQHVATSFHVQMAKTMSAQQRMAGAIASDDSENSEEINVSSDTSNPEPPMPAAMASNNNHNNNNSHKQTDEVYSCVYCKHSFKSQYCYQKHAKRHINPLTIDDTERIVETMHGDDDSDTDRGGGGGGAAANDDEHLNAGRKKTAGVRREVRPLDMNVQYYPCKTCGSKFPSYYFVHKHRKLCHANEEN